MLHETQNTEMKENAALLHIDGESPSIWRQLTPKSNILNLAIENSRAIYNLTRFRIRRTISYARLDFFGIVLVIVFDAIHGTMS